MEPFGTIDRLRQLGFEQMKSLGPRGIYLASNGNRYQLGQPYYLDIRGDARALVELPLGRGSLRIYPEGVVAATGAFKNWLVPACTPSGEAHGSGEEPRFPAWAGDARTLLLYQLEQLLLRNLKVTQKDFFAQIGRGFNPTKYADSTW